MEKMIPGRAVDVTANQKPRNGMEETNVSDPLSIFDEALETIHEVEITDEGPNGHTGEPTVDIAKLYLEEISKIPLLKAADEINLSQARERGGRGKIKADG